MNPIHQRDKYLQYLMEQHQIKEVAKQCPRILAHDATMWEKWVMTFARIGQLQLIGHHIPLVPKLSEKVYDLVLIDYLQKNPQVHVNANHCFVSNSFLYLNNSYQTN